MFDKISNLLKNGNNGVVLSKFLTIQEQASLKSNEVKIIFSNHYQDAERKRALIFPKHEEIEENFHTTLLEIIGDGEYGHRDILGSILALGLTREVIGDIIVNQDQMYVIVCSEVANYILSNLTKIKNSYIEVKEVEFEQIQKINQNQYIDKQVIVSSMRLDVILSHVLHLSREKAKQYILLGGVKVNDKSIIKIDYICKEDDRLSLSKRGRVIIKNILKTTKKDKLVLLISKTM